MLVQVIIKSKTRHTDSLYTYKVGDSLREQMKAGKRVVVPFGKGNKTSIGIVILVCQNVSAYRPLKEVYRILDDQPIVTKELMELAFYMKDRYLSDLTSAFATVFPPGDIQNINEIYQYVAEPNNEWEDFLIVPRSIDEIQERFPSISVSDIKIRLQDPSICINYSIEKKAHYKTERWIEKKPLTPFHLRGERQQLVMQYMTDHPSVSMKQAMVATGAPSSSIHSLVKKGYLEMSEKIVSREVLSKNPPLYDKLKLTPIQEQVFQQIRLEKTDKVLLRGVTGSGKTEIYLQLVEEALKKGLDSIILVPEISLTPQTIHRFSGRFGSKIAVLHSKLSIAERFEQWNLIKKGEVKIVVGARSAIFAPFANLGLMIIDEEHESSYASENHPKYDTIEIAEFRAAMNQATLILGTATPKVTTYYKVMKGDYRELVLNERIHAHPLPEVAVVDMREELVNGNFTPFSRLLYQQMKETLQQNNQIILFLNKRGHSSYVFCRKCGYIQKCKSCDVSMTYHKHLGHSVCHYCAETQKKPIICPECGSNAIKEFGLGTEKLEEEVQSIFPNARIARMDADTMNKKNSYQEIYQRVIDRKVDILIGTQMLSKGLDFPGVTLVGAIAADLTLNIPDYRSQERTFQLLTQVAGRSGRKEKGNVIIQTYTPNHYAIRCSKDHDYETFYQREIEVRQTYEYPPFSELVLVRVQHEFRKSAQKRAYEIYGLLKRLLDQNKLEAKLIGPAPAMIERLRNKYRFNIMIKTTKNLEVIKKLIEHHILLNQELNKDKAYTIGVTVNPSSLF